MGLAKAASAGRAGVIVPAGNTARALIACPRAPGWAGLSRLAIMRRPSGTCRERKPTGPKASVRG